ncbi:MAG: hypothetical protein ACTSPE_04510 [Candidatus Thorarchaeota archaeon]
MSSDSIDMRHEIFSRRGFLVGACFIAAILVVQSVLGFPRIWSERPVEYVTLVLVSAFVVGVASGSVLVYLIPPDQDVIGVAGLGSDDASQHIALFLVILSLIQPEISGFVFFYDYFSLDPLAPLWVIMAFAAPSAGFAAAMYERLDAIAHDLRKYFESHDSLDLSDLEWLHEYGARTSVYRMGMLESAASKIPGLRVRGHMIVKQKDPFPIQTE